MKLIDELHGHPNDELALEDVPLKQGLKHPEPPARESSRMTALEDVPLKQGLKRRLREGASTLSHLALEDVPLKQGLKPPGKERD